MAAAGNDGRRRAAGLGATVLVAVALFGCAVPSGEPALSPSSLSFPSTAIGATATRPLTITNVAASGALTLESAGIAGPDAAMFGTDFDDDDTVVLDPGASTTVTVTYDPTAAGDHGARLVVDNSSGGTIDVPLSGTAVVAPPGTGPLAATPAAVQLPDTALGATASHDVVLRNDAEGTVEVLSATVGGVDGSMFAVDGGALPDDLEPGMTLAVPVTFSPSATGPRTAMLSVVHSGTNSPLHVPLAGTGALPTSGTRTVLYRVNAGGPALPVAAPGEPAWTEDSGASPSPHGLTSTSTVAARWPHAVDLSDPSVPAGTPAAVFQSERFDAPAPPNLAYAFPVPAGTPVEVRVHLAEMHDLSQVVGGRVFDVLVDGSTAFRDVDVFARVGANRALVLTAATESDGTVDVGVRPGIGNAAVKGIEVVAVGDDVPPVLVPSTAGLDFSPAPLRQTVTRDLVVTNSGSGDPLTVTGTSITGADARMFADRFDDDEDVTLAAGESTTVTVAFLPSALGSRQASLSVAHTGVGGALTVPLSAVVTSPTAPDEPSFGSSPLAGAGVDNPTSLQFGPDGRLYVAQMDGTIRALTVVRSGPGQFAVNGAETIGLVRSLPNHDDDGRPNPSVQNRLVTGLLVTGTPGSPTIYVVSSDPRIGAGTSGHDLGLDTNSGVLSRLTRIDGTWHKQDVVRGLPRSEENHTGNGLAIDPATGHLLVAYGGNTNHGAPSHNFALLPEYALSGAILSIDVDAIGTATYDLPTLDDEQRPGPVDAGDPFGGNDGRNQARLVPGGPVQIHAAGFRNPYDLVHTADGLYTIDNGGNAGWGGVPQPDGPAGACTNAPVEPGATTSDALLRVPGPGFYGGHPNPTRANPANRFNTSNPQSPVPGANAVECDHRNEVERGALASFAQSTNGLTEYTASTFGGAMQGDLLAASHDDAIRRISLSSDGTSVESSTVLFTSAGQLPLDVTAVGDGGAFPGTIWVADFQGDAITVFEPEVAVCEGADDPAVDEDGDGFDNADEVANGTNPCSSADRPPDADGDHESDLLDPDDDDDGLSDVVDPFAVDAANGRATPLPVTLTWDNDAPPAGGLLGLGFTGVMADGTTDYAGRFDPARMTAGGAAGVVTLDEVGDGTASGAANTQQDGFQLGIDVTGASAPFVVRTRLPAPFSGVTPAGAQAYGVFFGTGDQDDYVGLTVAANGGAGGFALVAEHGGVPAVTSAPGPVWPSAEFVDLVLVVDPGAGTIQARVAVDGGPSTPIGAPVVVPTWWFDRDVAPAVGILATSAGPAPTFPATWDFLEIRPAGPGD